MARIYTPTGGEFIGDTIKNAVKIAWETNQPCSFTFNDIHVEVLVTDTVSTVHEKYEVLVKARHSNYIESALYKTEKLKSEQRLETATLRCKYLMEGLPWVLSGTIKDLLLWIREFQPVADHRGAFKDHQKLAEMLEQAGYVEHFGVGADKEFFKVPDNLGKYIVGQVIDHLRNDRPPHQVCLKFIDDYLKLLGD
jgi:hypothetical protein